MARRAAFFLAAFLLFCGLPILFPAIDLRASGLFYRPADGFFLGAWGPFHAIHADMHVFVTAIVIASAMLLAAAWYARRPILGVRCRAALFLLLALALGPGLVVNSLFKDHWGRARPAQITQFGGDKHFTPAFVPSDQCRGNCSFPAGDPAIGFFFVAPALLIAVPRRRLQAIAGAVALGAFLGVVRIAQGGHFLSDVIASGFLVFTVTWALHRWMIVHDGGARLLRWVRGPPRRWREGTLIGLGAAIAILISMAFFDRPLAVWFHDGDPLEQRLYRFITTFGVSTGYLVISGLLALGLGAAARWARDGALAPRLTLAAWRCAFVFASVAGAGLIGDILKPLFGRARPKLFFSEHLFAFTGHGARAELWSFPSGHTVTITALALSLSLIEPRGMPFFAAAALLVAASRVILAEHYLSDVIAGAILGAIVTWALWRASRRAGIDMRVGDNPRLSDNP